MGQLVEVHYWGLSPKINITIKCHIYFGTSWSPDISLNTPVHSGAVISYFYLKIMFAKTRNVIAKYGSVEDVVNVNISHITDLNWTLL